MRLQLVDRTGAVGEDAQRLNGSAAPPAQRVMLTLIARDATGAPNWPKSWRR